VAEGECDREVAQRKPPHACSTVCAMITSIDHHEEARRPFDFLRAWSDTVILRPCQLAHMKLCYIEPQNRDYT
jgi:hypothetical protein